MSDVEQVWGSHRIKHTATDLLVRWVCVECGTTFTARTPQKDAQIRAAAYAPTIFHRVSCRPSVTSGKNDNVPSKFIPNSTQVIGGGDGE